ncbi:hypothetical protein [Hyphococcus sp.]|uniref:hypothetical protein n=1 Tax=Hyphococcus sp. TaxID=2038636 RepID=UPI003CCC4352
MLEIVKIIRRTIEGSLLAMAIIAVAAFLGTSETINILLAERSIPSILFLLMIAIVLADIIAKIITILNTTFPDLVPDVNEADRKKARLIGRLRPGQTMALMSGAYTARVFLFIAIFAALGASYAAAPQAAQENLFGDFTAIEAIEAFIRQGVAGSIGYFLFFLGPDNLKPITGAIMTEDLVSASTDGDVFLAGVRLYGFAFVLAVLRTLFTPVTYLRARLRSRKISDEAAAA